MANSYGAKSSYKDIQVLPNRSVAGLAPVDQYRRLHQVIKIYLAVKPKLTNLKKTKTTPRLLGAKHLALLISCKPDRLSDEEQLWLKHIFQEPQVEKLYGIVQHFIEIICDRLADKFEPWVQDALAINISAVSSFVGGLKKDYSAIHAALIYPWSNGQVEGQVNRLKLINRQMYGRASFELLKARVLP